LWERLFPNILTKKVWGKFGGWGLRAPKDWAKKRLGKVIKFLPLGNPNLVNSQGKCCGILGLTQVKPGGNLGPKKPGISKGKG